jgi:hypothetical protein
MQRPAKPSRRVRLPSSPPSYRRVTSISYAKSEEYSFGFVGAGSSIAKLLNTFMLLGLCSVTRRPICDFSGSDDRLYAHFIARKVSTELVAIQVLHDPSRAGRLGEADHLPQRTKNGSSRQVPLPTPMVHLLSAYTKSRQPSITAQRGRLPFLVWGPLGKSALWPLQCIACGNYLVEMGGSPRVNAFE